MAIINGKKIIARPGLIDRNNTTTTPLVANDVYTGDATNIRDVEIVFVDIYADQDSAIDGLEIQQSTDALNWYHKDFYTVTGGTAKNYSINPHGDYLRVVYTNGDTDQGTFVLTTHEKGNSKPSSHRVQDTLADDDDGELVAAVLKLRTAKDTYVSGSSTESGNFKISLEECNGNIKDNITGVLTVIDYPHKEIHSGDAFIINEAFDLAINNVIDVRITTPNTAKWAHFILNFDTETEYEWFFYEVAVISNAGTAYTPINLNRNSANASGLAVDIITNTSLANANADTDVSGAVTLMHGYSGSGRAEGGSGQIREEFILKQNTIYDFRGTANAAGWIHGNMNWYEHTNI